MTVDDVLAKMPERFTGAFFVEQCERYGVTPPNHISQFLRERAYYRTRNGFTQHVGDRGWTMVINPEKGKK